MSSSSGLQTSVPPDRGIKRQAPRAPPANTYARFMMGRRVHAVVSRSSGQPSRERQPQVRVPSGPVGRGKKQRARVLPRFSGKNEERLVDAPL